MTTRRHTRRGRGRGDQPGEAASDGEVEGATTASFDGDLPISADAVTLTVKTRTGNTATANAQIVNMTVLGGDAGSVRRRLRSPETTKRRSGRMRRFQTTGLVSVDAGQNEDNFADANVSA
jgi:hypothetical protein